jgi:malate/lactate dehydrogenase
MHFEGVGDVCLSVPTIIGRGGVCERLPIAEVLEEEEKGYLRESAESIRSTIDSVEHV